MYNNSYSADMYANSELDRVAKAITDGATKMAFLDYAVRVYGILPESTRHEAMSAYSAFKSKVYADYSPPKPPNDFEDELEEASYNMQKATYDVLYWRKILKNNLPVPINTDPAARMQFATRDFMETFVNWASVFVPRVESIVDQFEDPDVKEYQYGNSPEERATVDVVIEQKDIALVPAEIVERMLEANNLVDEYSRMIPKVPTEDLMLWANCPSGFADLTGDERFIWSAKNGHITEAQELMLVERCRAELRVRAEKEGFTLPAFENN